MEDPSSAVSPAVAQTAAPVMRNQLPEPEQHLICPRCESTNTKFCYYNNYNLSQPRHFCKDCRRYWTKGGSLRNIPVGGGTRKASTRHSSPSSSSPTTSTANNSLASCGIKRPSTSPATSTSSNAAKRVMKPEPVFGACPSPAEARDQLLELSGPISPLLTANGMFGELLFNVSLPDGQSAAARAIPDSGFMEWELFPPPPQLPQQRRTSVDDCRGSEGVAPVVEENFLGMMGDSSCWGNISNGVDGWPDLAIYAPGANFQ